MGGRRMQRSSAAMSHAQHGCGGGHDTRMEPRPGDSVRCRANIYPEADHCEARCLSNDREKGGAEHSISVVEEDDRVLVAFATIEPLRNLQFAPEGGNKNRGRRDGAQRFGRVNWSSPQLRAHKRRVCVDEEFDARCWERARRHQSLRVCTCPPNHDPRMGAQRRGDALGHLRVQSGELALITLQRDGRLSIIRQQPEAACSCQNRQGRLARLDIHDLKSMHLRRLRNEVIVK